MEQLRYCGRGPWENYQDRNTTTFLGQYRNSISHQYGNTYIRPQESGYYTDTCWLIDEKTPSL